MALVNYSESESSEGERDNRKASNPKPASKSNSRRAIERSTTGKIKVALPDNTATVFDDNENIERPAKKARLGGGGLNSFLPAPKRLTVLQNGQKKGLGSGISLKTGATPGFSRHPEPPAAAEPQPMFDLGQLQDGGVHLQQSSAVAEAAVKPTLKEVMFKPLSVGINKKKKKKTTTASAIQGISKPAEPRKTMDPLRKEEPKTPLFNFGSESAPQSAQEASDAPYVPLMYNKKTNQDDSDSAEEPTSSGLPMGSLAHEAGNVGSNDPGQSLEMVASDLNLSESAKRQLFGRKGASSARMLASPNIINFNTDQEYAANEELRQAGETVQHNPLRAIAPGKHSLQQLVNAASNQKDALEDSFASGRRNKREAGSKYGW
ncbi:MAG: hypothetical protein M1814_002067 [Vezdaea aestivalis]|nr:MAG: hypothetical protein M1814_002067 [Vezdaea aestivalis]